MSLRFRHNRDDNDTLDDTTCTSNSIDEENKPTAIPSVSVRKFRNDEDESKQVAAGGISHITSCESTQNEGGEEAKENPANKEQPVTSGPSRIQQMYLTKDWWTMWIGLICFFIAVTITFLVPFERGGSPRVKYVVPQPMKWAAHPAEAWDLYNTIGTIFLLWLFLQLYVLSLSAMRILNEENTWKVYAKGFVGISIVATVAFWIGAQRWCQRNGFGYAIWSILFGMIIGNSPLAAENRLKAVKLVAKDGEYFIKCSLVLLAVEFSILGELGLPAIAVAWGASPLCLVSSYLIGRRCMKMDVVPALLVATGATWCGASAISAIASVVDAKNQDVVVCIGIVAAGTVIFTFAQPYFAILIGLDHHVAGAWIGGSVDQTGNVIASAAIVSDEATEVAGVVKIILNSSLGILATFVALWWQSNAANAEGAKKGFSWLYLWDKFPKFVLGFLICSGILTLITKEGTPEGDALQFAVHSMSKWWFSIAFCAIGITTNLAKLYEAVKSTGVIKLYLISNGIDMFLSFWAAWFLF